jgi:hypothetical protein
MNRQFYDLTTSDLTPGFIEGVARVGSEGDQRDDGRETVDGRFLEECAVD